MNKWFTRMAFADKFEWTPSQLLALIKEMDKLCPEEGLPNSQPINVGPQAEDTLNSPVTELPSSAQASW
jgi:hypothetical protein